MLAAAGAQAAQQANLMGGALGYYGGMAATPLMLAAIKGHTKVVDALLELAELNVNRQREYRARDSSSGSHEQRAQAQEAQARLAKHNARLAGGRAYGRACEL